MKNKKMTKRILTGVCALAFSLSIAAGISLAETKASADNVTLQAQASTFAIKEGAAVRITDPYGIRYTATISKDNYDTIASSYASVEYGVLICPTDLLAGKTLDFDTSDGLVPGNAAEGEVEFGFVKAIPVLDETKNVYTLKGSLVGIQEENLSRPFTGKAYIKATDAEGNVSYAYTTDESRAIYTVATYAVNDPDEEEKAKLDAVKEGVAQTPRAYLESVINKVQTVYGNPEITVTSSNTETAEYNILNGGDKITVSGKVSKTVNGVTRTLDACPTITADVSSGITLEQTSPNEYIVRGTNKTGFNLNATIGTGENKLSTVAFEEEVTSWSNAIPTAELGIPYDGGKPATLTPVKDEANTYQWTGSKYISVQPSMADTFEVGDRVVFDVYANDGILVAITWADVADADLWNKNDKKQYGTITNAAGEDVFSFRTLDSTGTQITKGPGNYKGEWLTFEITILKAAKESEDFKFNIIYYEIAGSYSLANGVYLRGFEVLKYTADTTVALADGVVIDEEKTYDFLTPINVGSVEVTDVRGVKTVLPASATGGYVKDGILYTGLGTQNIVISAEGYEGGLEYTINGASTGTVLDGQETISNIEFGANANMTYEQVYKLNKNAWVAGNNGVDDQYNDPMAGTFHEASDSFTLAESVASYTKAGMYLYVELYASSSFALSYYNSGLNYLYMNTSGFYKADGTTFETGNSLANGKEKCLKQWVTVELKVSKDWNSEKDGLSALNSQFNGSVLFGKITLSTTQIASPVIDLDTEISFFEDSTYASYITLGASVSTFEKTSDEGFEGAYKYTVNSTSNVHDTTGTAIVLSTEAKEALIKDGAHMYITVYKPEGFLFVLRGCGADHFLYGTRGNTSETDANSGVSWQAYVYDENGNPQKATKQAIGAWMTYEISFTATSEGKTTAEFFFYKYLTSGSSIYVKDFIWSSTQLTAFANAA